MNNVLAFIVFMAVLPGLFAAANAPWQNTLFSPLYRLLASLLLAAPIGYGLHLLARLSRRATQYRLAMLIGAVMLALGLAKCSTFRCCWRPWHWASWCVISRKRP